MKFGKKLILAVTLLLTIFSVASFAKKKCPPPSSLRSITSFYPLESSPPKDGIWKFYSDTFRFEDKDNFYDYWNVWLKLKIPNNVDSPSIYASKQIKHLLMSRPQETSSNYCDYTPDGADYIVEAYNPPIGP